MSDTPPPIPPPEPPGPPAGGGGPPPDSSPPPPPSSWGQAPPPPPPPGGWSQPPPPPTQPGGWGAPPPPQYGRPTGAKPSNYLVGAILSTLFCCLPLGIVSIVFAAQVDSKWNSGDYRGAQDASNRARQFMIASIAVGLVLVVGWVLLVAAGSSSDSGY